ncbi:hypothetical protein TPA0905_75120 [Streptomyces olivaceus]|nr:hypothetical protein TPA0905_75120 [Streptomyces olivaceus]
MTAGFDMHLFLANGQPDPAACPCPRAACGGLARIMGFKHVARCCPSDQPATA